MGKGAMGLFGANMADFQLGLALDDKAGGYLETDEEIAQARSLRFEVLRCLPFIGMNRLRERRSWLVSFSNLRPFGPFPVNTMLHAGRGRLRTTVLRCLVEVAPLHVRSGLGGLVQKGQKVFSLLG